MRVLWGTQCADRIWLKILSIFWQFASPSCINSIYDYGFDYNVTSVLTVIRQVIINGSLSLWRDRMIYFLSCHSAKTFVTPTFPACRLCTAHSQGVNKIKNPIQQGKVNRVSSYQTHLRTLIVNWQNRHHSKWG